jgi:hypothetical protein
MSFKPAGANDLTPQSWEKGFFLGTASASLTYELGVTVGASYFYSLPWEANQSGWWGVSIDAGITAGGGFAAGAQAGATYGN